MIYMLLMFGFFFKVLFDRIIEYEIFVVFRIFDFMVGGDGFVFVVVGYYIENIGSEDLIFFDVL